MKMDCVQITVVSFVMENTETEMYNGCRELADQKWNGKA